MIRWLLRKRDHRARRLIKRLGRSLTLKLRGFLAKQSLVSNDPVIEAEQFPFLQPLHRDWRQIHAEVTKILEHKDCIPGLEEVCWEQRKVAMNRQWQTFFLFGFGEKSEKNCAQAPHTTALLEQIPGLQTAWFSILAPGYHVPPHRGITNGIVRCHLGLIVPDDRQNCWMRIDHERRTWAPGDLLVFDDTYDHEVKNETPQERVVLLIDFERPMRFWGRVMNRLVIQAFKFTAFYREPKRKLKTYEERFEAAARRADAMLEGDRPAA